MDIIHGLQRDYFNTAMFMTIGIAIIKIIIILVLASVVTRIASKAIRNFFKMKARVPGKVNEGREQTLIKLCENIVYYVIYFIAIVTILGLFGIQLGPILASAGVLGLAIGFGAQGLVKDVVTGFFILFENQYGVGDKVRMNGIEGIVEELGLRTTKVKGDNGEYFYLSNSSITQVANLTYATEPEQELEKAAE
jgi:moderate conductance mechanosensitive channel